MISRLRPWLAVLLVSLSAWADSVVILEIDGDASGLLRTQLESVLANAGTVEVVAHSRYRDEALRARLRGTRMFSAEGVRQVGAVLPFDAAVGGEVSAREYRVIIFDRAGQTLWTRDIPVSRGLLSDELAGRLARAIAAAARQGAQPGAPRDGDQLPGPVPPRRPAPGEDPPPAVEDEGDRDLVTLTTDEARVPGPPLVKGVMTGTTIWRSQCLRPGVDSCGEYDAALTKPPGIIIDFRPAVPYLGFNAELEVFPLARLTRHGWHRFINGLGLTGSFQLAPAPIRTVEETPQGQGQVQSTRALDLGWSMNLVYRVHFALGVGTPAPTGFAGVRAGLLGRAFTIDPTPGTSLPSSQRVSPTGLGFPVVGVEASIPVVSFFRLEVGAALFLGPRTAPEQIVGYGDLTHPTGGVTSSGFLLEAGLAGDLWGPLGYLVRFRSLSFFDRYYGQGQKWTVCSDADCGGAAEESFFQLFWGVSVKL